MKKLIILFLVLIFTITSFAEERKTVKLGELDFPVYTNQEIDSLPMETIRNLHIEYLKVYLRIYVMEWMKKAKQNRNPFPDSMFVDIARELYETINDEKAREITKLFYTPGGVDEVNKIIFPIVDKHVQLFEQQRFGKTFPREAPPLRNEIQPEVAIAKKETKEKINQIVEEGTNKESDLKKLLKNPIVIVSFLVLILFIIKKFMR